MKHHKHDPAIEAKLTAQMLRELVHYDPLTGLFTWLAGYSDSIGRDFSHKVGAKAGSTYAKTGYGGIQIDGQAYQYHRLAWLYMTGSWPADLIDHRDGNPSNNKWENLRSATTQQNSMNRKTPVNNKAGVKGVRLCPKYNRWIATIYLNGKRTYVGNYETCEEAVAAREELGRQLHGDFYRGK